MASLPAHRPGNDSEREERLHEVIAAYLEAIETGAAPDRDILLEREPELADELATFFANQDHLGRLAGPPHARSDEPLCDDGGAVPDDRTDIVPQILPYPVAWEAEIDPRRRAFRYFGDYELLGVIARGGMGIVYKARQVSLNRDASPNFQAQNGLLSLRSWWRSVRSLEIPARQPAAKC